MAASVSPVTINVHVTSDGSLGELLTLDECPEQHLHFDDSTMRLVRSTLIKTLENFRENATDAESTRPEVCADWLINDLQGAGILFREPKED